MNKFVWLGVVIAACVVAFTAVESDAKSSYGAEVDAFCLDSNPYAGKCTLCHLSDNDTKTRTDEMDAYLSGVRSGDLCYFCSSDSNCTSGPACIDGDYDGFYPESGCGTAVDCNDNNAAINPGAAEVCNDSVDNNCNGNIDSQDPACGTLSCTDADGDGFSVEGGACGTMDCHDGNPEIYPGAIDKCNDGIDQDCSGKDRTKGKECKTTTNTTTSGREGKGRTCSDGLDNDGDELYDCDDPDCERNRKCRG